MRKHGDQGPRPRGRLRMTNQGRQSVRAWLKSNVEEGTVTHAQIQRKLGLVSKGHLGRILDGERGLRLGRALSIAKICGLSVDECGRMWIEDEIGLGKLDELGAEVVFRLEPTSPPE